MLPAGIRRAVAAVWACSIAGAPTSDATPCAPPLRPLIAEVLYDAAGDDTGLEFVELFNPHPAPYALAGVRLEAGDGSGAGRWTLRWTGSASDSVPAGGRFVIGGARVVPTPQAVVGLDLQNGPDAVRCVWPDGVTEMLGWGEHEFGEYFCSSPAPDVASGQSLARTPDDAGSGSNLVDFRPAVPSPGRSNQVRRDLAIVAGTLMPEPEQPPPFAAWRLRLTVQNAGTETIVAGAARIEIAALPDSMVVAGLAPNAALLPGDRAEILVERPGLDAGKRLFAVAARLDGDERPANDADSIRVRVGPGPLAITEIQFHPAAGEGEWVEVLNRSAFSHQAADFRLSDRQQVDGVPGSGAAPLAAGQYAVLVQNRVAFLTRYPAVDSSRVWSVEPWPSLNNNDDEHRVADVVTLREADGTLVDRVPYSAAETGPGIPLERGAGDLWAAAPEASGTPLGPPRVVPAVAGGLEVEPRRLTAAAGTGRIRWTVPWPRARVALDLYDLAGRHRATLLAETLVSGRGERLLSSGDLDAGLYVIVLSARPESGDGVFTARRAVRVGGGR